MLVPKKRNSMDLLITYPNFKRDIEYAFHDLIEEFHLKLLELGEGSYLLKGTTCNIRFGYDRGDTVCQFKQVTESYSSPGYSVLAVFKSLCPTKEASNKHERIYDARLQLLEYANMVRNLKSVLNGDFSWLKEFIEKQEREDKLSLFVVSKLDMNNPISKKFWSGDMSWQQDLESYLRENNLSL